MEWFPVCMCNGIHPPTVYWGIFGSAFQAPALTFPNYPQIDANWSTGSRKKNLQSFKLFPLNLFSNSDIVLLFSRYLYDQAFAAAPSTVSADWPAVPYLPYEETATGQSFFLFSIQFEILALISSWRFVVDETTNNYSQPLQELRPPTEYGQSTPNAVAAATPAASVPFKKNENILEYPLAVASLSADRYTYQISATGCLMVEDNPAGVSIFVSQNGSNCAIFHPFGAVLLTETGRILVDVTLANGANRYSHIG